MSNTAMETQHTAEADGSVKRMYLYQKAQHSSQDQRVGLTPSS